MSRIFASVSSSCEVTHREQEVCSARELAERMGHSKASMSLDVYTHVMPPDEADPESLSALLVMPR
jgi:integrase